MMINLKPEQEGIIHAEIDTEGTRKFYAVSIHEIRPANLVDYFSGLAIHVTSTGELISCSGLLDTTGMAGRRHQGVWDQGRWLVRSKPRPT